MFRLFNKVKNIFYGKDWHLIQSLEKNYSTLLQNKKSGIEVTSQTENIKSVDEIPGPKIWPIIGNLLELKEYGMKNSNIFKR